MLCASSKKGTGETEQFGSLKQYDKTTITGDPKCPLDENAVLWVYRADTNGLWTHIVKAVDRGVLLPWIFLLHCNYPAAIWNGCPVTLAFGIPWAAYEKTP